VGAPIYTWTPETETGFLNDELEALWAQINTNETGLITELDDVPDVTITSVADNELLAYDSGSGDWINQTPTEAGLSASGHNHDATYLKLSGGTVTGDLTLSAGMLNVGAPTELTLDASGLITVTKSRHAVDTYADASSDDLVSIARSGGTVDGDIVILHNVSGARTVTVKDNTGNIQLAGGDCLLDNPRDTLMLIYDDFSSKWLELSRSLNA
jgi:hypothetical protein